MVETTSSEATKESAAWKFSLLETVNADPLLNPADLKVVLAYLMHASHDRREAYLANSRAYALTGIRSHTTMAESRSRLQKRGYLRDIGKRTPDGCTWFQLENPRKELVADHVLMTIEAVRERETFRKSEDRRRAVAKQKQHAPIPPESGPLSTSETGPPILPCPSTNYQDSPSFCGDNPLEQTLGIISHRNTRPVFEGSEPDPWGIFGTQLRPLSEVQADMSELEKLKRLGLTLQDVAVF